MIVACDSTALINLALIQSLHLLEKMFGEVLIPPQIYTEVVIDGAGQVGAEEVKNASFIQTVAVTNEALMQPFLELGEEDASVIALAIEQGASLIISRDRRLRRHANQSGLTAIDTFHFLVATKSTGHISNVKYLLDEMRNKGVLIRQGVYERVLREADEM
jgi:uncharacterized protein